MVTKAKTPVAEKFSNVDIDLFEVLAAIDKKDYGYYARLTPEQQKKVALVVLVQWAATIKGSAELQGYYLRSVDFYANKYLFNENVMKHPELVWMMLCASSPGMGKQFHQWIPNISKNVALLIEPANLADAKKYFAKIYPKASTTDVAEVSKEFVIEQKRKCYLASIYPQMKHSDVETLSHLVSDAEIAQYEKDRGN
jgi:hypothetical protein